MANFVDRMLHRRYIEVTTLESVVDRASPLLAMIPKIQRGGDSVNEACRPAGPQGFSYDLTSAQTISSQTDSGASSYEEFTLPFGQYFGSVVMSARGLAGSKGREDAYLQELVTEMDASLEAYGSIAARKIFGPVGGSIGRILSVNQGGNNGEMSLTLQEDTFNFVASPTLQVQAAAADGSSSTTPRAGVGFVALTVPGADVAGGSTTGWHVMFSTSYADATASTPVPGLPSGWQNNDYLFRLGDVASGQNLSDKEVRSLQGFITLNRNTSTYLGASRKQAGMDGFRLSAAAVAGLSIKERIQKLITVGRKQFNANKVDTIGLGPDTWHELQQDVLDTGWQNFGKVMDHGAGTIKLHTANGEVDVVSDPFVSAADIWALSMSKLKLYTYNGFPGPFDEDGLKMLRKSNSPDYEIRWQSFNCLSVGGSPWHFGRTVSGVTATI